MQILFLLIFFIILQSLLIVFYSKISKEIGFIDYPSGRKNHKGLIPLVGGISIYSSMIIFFVIFPTNFPHKIIFASSFLIFFIGLLDDKFNLGVLERLFFQIIATLLVIGFNIKIIDIGQISNIYFHLGNFGLVLSFLCIIGFTNAINFTDGMDGLAAGYILNCLFAIIFFSYLGGNILNLEPLFFLILTLIIFLFSNHAFLLPKTFLGDAGSTSIGFLLSCYLIYFTMPDNRYFHPVLTLWAAPIPIFDFFTVFINRIYNRVNPFKPDRIHIHYLIMEAKIPIRLIPITLISISTLLSIMGYLIFVNLGALHCLVLFLIFFVIYFLITFYLKKKFN